MGNVGGGKGGAGHIATPGGHVLKRCTGQKRESMDLTDIAFKIVYNICRKLTECVNNV